LNQSIYYLEVPRQKPKSHPDLTNYSKQYNFHLKGKLEIRISLVRVARWMNQFLWDARNPPDARQGNELTPRELKEADEQIIKMAQ